MSEIRKKINIPQEFVGKTLVDKEGNIYQITPHERPVLGGLFRFKELKIVQEKKPLERSLEENIVRTAQTSFRSWAEKTIKPALLKTSLSAAPLIEDCLRAGQKNFRKEFVSIIGAQGEKMFLDIVEKKMQDIGELWARNAQKDSTLHVRGPYPQGLRFAWELKTPDHEFVVYCVEQCPQRRTVNFQEEYGEESQFRRFAFPWMYFVIFFRDGIFRSAAAFYRGERIQDTNDSPCFTNLPSHFAGESRYYAICDERMPSIKLSSPDWDQIFFDWYWGSKFYNHGELSIRLWDLAAEKIPEVSSSDAWQKLSDKDNFAETVCKLPWIPCEFSLGGYVKWVLGDICNSASGNEVLDGGKAKAISAGIAQHATHFRELLEEKIVFLGNHFSIPHEYFEAAREFLESGIRDTCERLVDSLNGKCNRIAKKAGKDCLDDAIKIDASRNPEREV